MNDFEYKRFDLPRQMSRNAARRLLTDEAEYRGWELARVRLFADGTRHIELRRRILRVARTF